MLTKEADFTLDDSFWNEDSPVGKEYKWDGIYASKGRIISAILKKYPTSKRILENPFKFIEKHKNVHLSPLL